ncbi:hypothetical protein CI102_14674 [Trichoderma harzianum]|uniref:Uncharacterized protein n=1 Tax=Trichoderma harzianum CBS 226.95 TaxID=983964 RepID=A0A2T4ADM2_TRIHA|nr:hypothetical protein M431DRAFT_438177 [Trichoderma harzianum CBS 226.95]PKK41518.1 hypothetical protein CI102_14674 [Trichoderma harzianum]PTB55146.1 hypothetical protein M431DRAFT_438177 [Trichoderma harzianum CBS 226.95]
MAIAIFSRVISTSGLPQQCRRRYIQKRQPQQVNAGTLSNTVGKNENAPKELLPPPPVFFCLVLLFFFSSPMGVACAQTLFPPIPSPLYRYPWSARISHLLLDVSVVAGTCLSRALEVRKFCDLIPCLGAFFIFSLTLRLAFLQILHTKVTSFIPSSSRETSRPSSYSSCSSSSPPFFWHFPPSKRRGRLQSDNPSPLLSIGFPPPCLLDAASRISWGGNLL